MNTSPTRLRAGFAPDVVDLARRRSPSKPLRVMVVHSSHTGGHAAAADALVSALKELPNVEAESLNTLKLSSSKVTRTQSWLYKTVSERFPWMRRLGFEAAIQGIRPACWMANLALQWKTRNSPEVLDYITSKKPDILVSTHSQTNSMLAYWKDRNQLSCPIHSCPTDFLSHMMWEHSAIDHYYVASPAAAQDLEGFGVSPSKLTVTGIPIRPALAHPPAESQAALRERLGLDPHRPVVLVAGGSLGYQPYRKIVEEFDKLPDDFQLVAVTARNQAAQAELDQLHPKRSLTVLGYVNNMDEWMRASDVVLTKPGGLTCSEVLALGKPMIFLNPYPGLEQHQVRRLTGDGVAVEAPTVADAGREIRSMLSDQRRRDELASRVAALAQPASAYRVAEHVIRAAAGGASPSSSP